MMIAGGLQNLRLKGEVFNLEWYGSNLKSKIYNLKCSRGDPCHVF
jgi:hypothetical protein